MTDSKLLDSSVWLAYFYAENNEIKSIVESNIILLTSSISLFEVKNKLIKDKTDSIKIQNSVDFIKQRSLIIDVGAEIAEEAVEIAKKNKLPIIESLIYASSLKNNSELITLDNEFRDLDNVKILKN
ncbi:MAG: PIN domain-containing protein [Nanoarchaeota archaeon]